MRQPSWQFVANFGDASPLEHGGLFLYEDETGVYGFEAERVEVEEHDGTLTVHRICLDRCKEVRVDDRLYLVPHTYDGTYPHPIASYVEWFAPKLQSIAARNGTTADELRRLLCSADGVERLEGYRAIYDDQGWVNGDHYPSTLTYAEALVRYQDDAIKPESYHDCVCCGETLMCALLCPSCVKAGCVATYEYGDWHFASCDVPQCLDCRARLAHER